MQVENVCRHRVQVHQTCQVTVYCCVTIQILCISLVSAWCCEECMYSKLLYRSSTAWLYHCLPVSGATAAQGSLQYHRLQLQSGLLAGPPGGGQWEVTAVCLDVGAGTDLLGIHQHILSYPDCPGRFQCPGCLLAHWRKAWSGEYRNAGIISKICNKKKQQQKWKLQTEAC